MTWDSALGSVIEVAVGIAGFSGIVAAVGRRREGQWDPMDQLLLRVLLLASGIAILFSFLPFTLIELMEPRLVWCVLSGLMAMWVLGIAILRTRQGAELGAVRKVGLGNPFILIGAFLVFFIRWWPMRCGSGCRPSMWSGCSGRWGSRTSHLCIFC